MFPYKRSDKVLFVFISTSSLLYLYLWTLIIYTLKVNANFLLIETMASPVSASFGMKNPGKKATKGQKQIHDENKSTIKFYAFVSAIFVVSVMFFLFLFCLPWSVTVATALLKIVKLGK